MGYALFAISGDCGTLWPGWWRGPNPPPWWSHFAAAIGGILGGMLVQQVIGASIAEPTALLASMAGSFASGRVLSALAIQAFGAAGAGQIAQQKAVA